MNKKLVSGKLYFILSIGTSFFWLSGNLMDIYHYPFVGALFELLWLPMLIMLFVLPVLCLVFWAKEKFIFKSFYLYSILIFIATMLFMQFRK